MAGPGIEQKTGSKSRLFPDAWSILRCSGLRAARLCRYAVMNMQETLTVATLPSLVGRELAPSEWILMSQARIDAFADCTDDHQFIHVDEARARQESPYGERIAHGFLSLSLLAAHQPADFPALADLSVTINYGLDKVRFLAPVRSGRRVRIRTSILEVTPKHGGRMLVKNLKTMEIEGEDKPAYVAEQLSMFIAR
jgi:acyl dehydratase